MGFPDRRRGELIPGDWGGWHRVFRIVRPKGLCLGWEDRRQKVVLLDERSRYLLAGRGRGRNGLLRLARRQPLRPGCGHRSKKVGIQNRSFVGLLSGAWSGW